MIWLALIPADPKNAWLLGFSKTRIGLLSAALGAGLLAAGLLVWARRSRWGGGEWSRRLNRTLQNETFVRRALWGAVGAFTLGGCLLALAYTITEPFWGALLARLSPFTAWLAVLGVQTVLFLRDSKLAEMAATLQARAAHWLRETGRVSPFRVGSAVWSWPRDVIVVAVLLLPLAFATLRTGTMVIDDAWITFKFARNLAQGHGLRWEAAAAPVEGYSNLLEVLIVALGLKLGLDPVTVARGVAALSTVGLVAAAYALLLRLTGARGLAALAVLLYTLHPAAALHTWAGLETQLFAFLAVLLLLVFERAQRGGAAAHPGLAGAALPLIAFLLALARTEGVLLGALALPAGYLLARNRASRAGQPGDNALAFTHSRHWLAGNALFFASVAAYTLFRWLYFGTLFTGPHLVKLSNRMVLAGLTSAEFLADAWAYFSTFPLGMATLAAAAITLSLLPGLLAPPRARLAAWGVFLLAWAQLAALLFVYSRTRMIQNFAARFLFNSAGQQIVLAGLAAARVWRGWIGFVARPQRHFASSLYMLVIAVLLAVFTYGWFAKYPRVSGGLRNFVAEYNQQQSAAQAIARGLNRFDLADEWLVTVVDSGILPYYAQMKTLGGDGLTDLTLAELVPPVGPRARPYAQYIFALAPAALVIERFPGEIDAHHAALLCAPEFARYAAVARFERKTGLYEVYLRDDLPQREALTAALLAQQDPSGRWKVSPPPESDPEAAQYVQEGCNREQ